MKYIAITQQTAEWLLGKPALRNHLCEMIAGTDLRQFKDAEIAEGALRIAGSLDERVLAIWNVDYITNTGEESWGFIRIESPLGIFDLPEIAREVFDRCLYVINQRLQGLIIDTGCIHKSYNSGANSCLAGRGAIAHQLSIGYMDSDRPEAGGRQRAVICVGPSRSYDAVDAQAAREGGGLRELCGTADGVCSPLRRRPALDISLFPALRNELVPEWSRRVDEYVNINAQTAEVTASEAFRTVHWGYSQWTELNSPLSPIQRRILESGAIESHPIRITGPGGSGKTLLMLLIAMRLLLKAKEGGATLRILFLAHNAQMVDRLTERVRVLGGGEFIDGGDAVLEISTLNSFGKEYLGLTDAVIIDKDAEKTKEFQREEIKAALLRVLSRTDTSGMPIISQMNSSEELLELFSHLVASEISISIKAHGLNKDRKRYVQSEHALSRLHGSLNLKERGVVFDVFDEYHGTVFEHYGVLDSDDIALELLARLRAPVRQLKRKTQGFDYVLVDEAQLFNENERRIFPLLTKGDRANVPIALALDEAQEPYGQSSAGLALLGFDKIENEILPDSHRSTKEIVDLSFFLLQRTTDLFSHEFPDYTAIGNGIQSAPKGVDKPSIACEGKDSPGFAKFISRRVRELRKANCRQIAVVCHADSYWRDIHDDLAGSTIPLTVLTQRGQYVSQDQPIVVLSRPSYIGGQEFDAVIAVGLEQGVYPPKIRDNEALAAALEQQALREMYLTFTRARHRVIVVLSKGAVPNAALQEALQAQLLTPEQK